MKNLQRGRSHFRVLEEVMLTHKCHLYSVEKLKNLNCSTLRTLLTLTIECINSVIKSEIFKKISDSSFHTVIVDETTGTSVSEMLIIYMRI